MSLEKMKISRRRLMKGMVASGTLVAGATVISSCSKNDGETVYLTESKQPDTVIIDEKEIVYPGAAPHNCKGRCVNNVHVKNGVIRRISTDERPDDPSNPQLRSCLRCRSYRLKLYSPGRLLYPLVYALDEPETPRGDLTKFKRVTWQKVAMYIKTKYDAIKAATPNMMVLNNYGSGMSGVFQNKNMLLKVVNEKMGGSVGVWGYPSFNAGDYLFSITNGHNQGNLNFSPENVTKAKTLFLWGSNLAHTTGATGYQWWVTRARENGTKIIYIGPLYNKTAEMADEFIPLKPGSDTALLLAMIYVMMEENLLDTDSIDNYTLGFFDDPTGAKTAVVSGENGSTVVPAGKSLSAYIWGGRRYHRNSGACSYTMNAGSTKYDFKKDFLTPKTPEWAAPICGVSAEKIRELARIYADTGKPCAVRSSIGMQRQPNGVQNCWLLSTMALITGNWGIEGTGVNFHYFRKTATAISGLAPAPSVGINPEGPRPIICSQALWLDAVRAKGNPTTNAKWKYDAEIMNLTRPIKIIMNYGGNSMVNQHQDTFASTSVLANRSDVELIVTVDNLMTTTARWSDVVLPGDAHYEREDLIADQNYVIYQAKAVEPMGEIKANDEIAYIIGAAFGMEKWEVNPDQKSYAQRIADSWNSRTITLDEFKKKGIYTNKSTGVELGSTELRAQGPISPTNKLSSATGYFEIYSNAVVRKYENRNQTGVTVNHPNRDSDNDMEVLPIPFWIDYNSSYIDLYNGVYDNVPPLNTNDYPYMVLGCHSMWRVHSIHHSLGYLRELYLKDKDGNRAYDHTSYSAADWTRPNGRVFSSSYNGVGYEPIWMNPKDVKNLELKDGALVKVTSAQTRKTLIASVYETPRCLPGVFVLEQGAWFDPIELKDGTTVDRGGCSSTLISEMPTRNDRGPAMMMCHVKIEPFSESEYKQEA